jgi:hypothetical protein
MQMAKRDCGMDLIVMPDVPWFADPNGIVASSAKVGALAPSLLELR